MANPRTASPDIRWLQRNTEPRARERDELSTNSEYADLLLELHQLLEDYAPLQYTERLHERTEQVLRQLYGL